MKIYKIKFMEHMDSLKKDILVSEDNLNFYKDFGGGIKTLEYVGNLFLPEKKKKK